MPSMYDVTFLATGEVRDYVTAYGYEYVLGDATKMTVYSQLVWCEACGNVTLGEMIETVEELDALIASIEDPNSRLYQALTYDVSKRHRAEAVASARKDALQRKQWRSQRNAPPKCLTCGTTNIVMLRNGEVVETRGGGIQLKYTGLCTVNWKSQYYSPEGDRIDYRDEIHETPSPSRRKWWQFW